MTNRPTICIVHYTTPELTKAAVLSIRKQGVVMYNADSLSVGHSSLFVVHNLLAEELDGVLLYIFFVSHRLGISG